jgi:hypothetical protein
MYAEYYALREKRLQLQREVDALEQQEKDLLYEITKPFDTNFSRGYHLVEDGFVLKANPKETVLVRDWAAVLGYIKETGEVDLLQKRLTESAVKARWDVGATVPGTEKSHKWAVTITKAE